MRSSLGLWRKLVAPVALALVLLGSVTTPLHAQTCAQASGLELPVKNTDAPSGLVWDVPFNPFGNYLEGMGGYHPGEDWNLVNGSPDADLGKSVYAIGNGTVAAYSSLGALGKLLAIRHTGSFVIPAQSGSSNGQSYSYSGETVTSLYSIYIHIQNVPSALQVVGACVSGGTSVGTIVDSGNGPHLHFEIRHPSQQHSTNWSMVGPSSNWVGGAFEANGYYLDLQTMVNAFLRHPRSVIAANPGTGSLVVAPNQVDVYYLQNGRVYHVTSYALAAAMESAGARGWVWNARRQLTQAEFNQYTVGPDFIASGGASNGLLVRDVSNQRVYAIEGASSRWIRSDAAVRWFGTNWWPNVIEMPGSVVSSYLPVQGTDVYAVGEEPNGALNANFQSAYQRLMGSCGTTTSWKGWPGTFATCLEFPQSTIQSAAVSAVSTLGGSYQNYGNESVRFGGIISSALGTFGVWGAIYTAWQGTGYSAGGCGFPTSDEYAWGSNRRSDFEGGYIYWVPSIDTTFVMCGGTPTRIIAVTGDLAFGDVAVGTTATRTLTITNTGNATLTVTSINYPAGLSGAWGGTIIAGGSRNVTVTFAPMAATTYGGTVTVNANHTSGTNTIAASGTGVTRIMSLGGSLAFGAVQVGATATRTLTISNTGNRSLTVSSISYPTGFTGAWSGTIPAGGSENVTVTFAPVAAITYGGTVTVNGNQTSGLNTMWASGAGSETRIIAVTGDLAFGDVAVGTTATRTLTITNTGNATLTVTSINYPAGLSGAWGGTIIAGGSRNVTVTFAPMAATTYGGTVTVNANHTSGTNTIAASGTGVTRIMSLGGSLAFGAVQVGATATRTLTISNTGNRSLTVSSISYPTGFTGAWSGTIPAGGSENVTVTFAPVAAITYGGTVTVNGNQTSGINTIVASGTGTPLRPDLVITALSDPPLYVAPGSSFGVSDTTANQGPVAAGSSTTAYYLSLDTNLDSQDTRLGQRVVSGIAAGGSSAGAVTVSVPSTTASGTYYLLAVADCRLSFSSCSSDVAEEDETNNTRVASSRVQVARPDLVIAALGDPPLYVAPGSSFIVSDTIANQAPVAAGSSTTGYYVSLDTNLDSQDRRIGQQVISGLAAGAASAGAVTVSVPSTTASGTYYLLAVADCRLSFSSCSSDVAEENEANNTRAAAGRLQIVPTGGPLPFTDDPLLPASTRVKTIHITEMRSAINQVRAKYALAPFVWTDATLTAGIMPVKAVHLTELRTALAAAYLAAGRLPPTYTSATITSRVTVITVVHIAELRAAVRALW